MKYWIASALVGIALFLDTASYWRQIRKTLKTKKSSQVSTTAFLYKIAKACCAITGLAICSNFVGLGMEVFMSVVYIVSLIIIAKYKPKGWRLF
jgi:uncharacterized protein with PQ loop repeat